MGAGIQTDRYKVKEGEKVNLDKWSPDTVVSSIIVERLEELGMEYPKLSVDPKTASL